MTCEISKWRFECWHLRGLEATVSARLPNTFQVRETERADYEKLHADYSESISSTSDAIRKIESARIAWFEKIARDVRMQERWTRSNSKWSRLSFWIRFLNLPVAAAGPTRSTSATR